jgi:protein SCO1
MSKSSREAIRRRHLPDVLVQTHEGKAALFYEDLVKDRIVVLNFMYLNCESTCPATLHALMEVHSLLKSRIGRDIFMYSITLDPERDSVAALAKEARSHGGARPGWLFLRASPPDTEVLRRSLGFVSSDPVVDANKSAHAAMVRFGNEPRELWSKISAFATPDVIARSILWVAPKVVAPQA